MTEAEAKQKVDKLPVWAQDYIRNLERRESRAVKELKNHLDSQTPSKIFVGNAFDEAKRFIQDDRVTFIVSGGQIDCRVRDGGVWCMATYGCADFVVVPNSSNVVSLEIRSRKQVA